MSKLEEIFIGWKNLIFENEKLEEIAKERIRICVEECKTVDGSNGLTEHSTCKVCGCYMPAKTRSPQSSCPLNKWRAV